MHICVSKQTLIGSDNGLSPGPHQAIIWTKAGILLIGPLGTKFNEILIEIHTFSFKEMHLKMLSGKWRPFCLGLNVLTPLVLRTRFPLELFSKYLPLTLEDDYFSEKLILRKLSLEHIHFFLIPQILHVTTSWWRHQMGTFSALLAICAGNSRSPVNSPHKGQWRRALMFSLICVWINNWVNNSEAGDLRPYRAHYDVTVMLALCPGSISFVSIHLSTATCVDYLKKRQEHTYIAQSISWLMMPWLLVSPGHHQPWYWLCPSPLVLSPLS